MNQINRRSLLKQTAYTSAALALNGITSFNSYGMKKSNTQFRLLRHATVLIKIAGKALLVDPMLSKKFAMDPIQNAASTSRIPMVDLPVNDEELSQLLNETDAVFVTHTHRDHWDVAAQQMIPKDKLIFCQPVDETKIKEQGFANVQPVAETFEWNNIRIYRTGGQHGTGEIGKKMGHVSGYVLEYKKEKIYIAGDTIWCSDVADAITKYQPAHVIINGGGAQFLEGDPITMTTNDLVELSKYTKAKISVVHLETINHCYQRRPDFKKAIEENQLTHRVNIPGDGEWVSF